MIPKYIKNPELISKLYKGFLKMVSRQNKKPEISRVPTGIMSYSEKHGEYRELIQKHHNSKWNGTNLNCLCSSLNTSVAPTTGMYTKRRINQDGKYILSMHGQQILKKKKLKKTL